MTTTAEAWLAHLERHTWLTHAPTGLVRVTRGGEGRWTIGSITVTEPSLLAAQPPGPPDQARQFHLMHDGWRVASFRLFRPLVYFAAFGSPVIFEALRLAVTSLLEQGGWQWEILVMTAPETADTVLTVLASARLGERLHIATLQAPARLDWNMARYRLDAHGAIARSQPLLYLDVDIACDRPLEPLLMQLAAGQGIHACAEGTLDEGHPESDGNWFGWRMMVEDGMQVDLQAPGFSAGALGFANTAVAEVPFSLMLWSRYGDAARPDGGHRLAGLDQAWANYVFRKLGCHELKVMTRFMRLYRLKAGAGPYPDPAAALGLVHFLGGPMVEKVAAMQAYVQALRPPYD